MTGQKPLSSFGVIHSFTKHNTKELFRAKYEGFAEELNEARTKKGFVAFLIDNFVDVKLLEDEQPNGRGVNQAQEKEQETATVISP